MELCASSKSVDGTMKSQQSRRRKGASTDTTPLSDISSSRSTLSAWNLYAPQSWHSLVFQDTEYTPNPDGSVWPDEDNVSISFDAGCDYTTNETTSASTTDYDGREKSVPGGHQRPNDSSQFELQTEKIFTKC